ncbi:MAG: hypothetical protein J5756_01125 [Clostridia bacterium]|nr:hypothetical protein [Clostridia bacterium]
MKRIIAIIAVLCLAFALTACDKPAENGAGGDDIFGWGAGESSGSAPESSSERSSGGLFNQSGSSAELPASDESSSAEQSSAASAEQSSAASAQPPVSSGDTSANNYFLNENNHTGDPDKVSIRPRYLVWNNGKLVAECFIINNKSVVISDIKIDELKFSNSEGDIAAGSFGELSGLTIQPNSYVVWSFTFSGSMIKSLGAKLSSLNTTSTITYSYDS